MQLVLRFEEDYCLYSKAASVSPPIALVPSTILVIEVISETDAMDYDRGFLANLSLVVFPRQ